jgi:hypothetical protein
VGIDTWRPTPAEERRKARRLCQDGWETVEVSELHKGDIFQMVYDGESVHPETGDPDVQTVAVAVADPIRNDPLGSTGQCCGYAVEIDVFDSLDEVKKSLS